MDLDAVDAPDDLRDVQKQEEQQRQGLQQPHPNPEPDPEQEDSRGAPGSTAAKFLDVLPIVFNNHRGLKWAPAERYALRSCSRALRDLHDANVLSISLSMTDKQLELHSANAIQLNPGFAQKAYMYDLPPADAVEAAVRGVVARGGRPCDVAVDLPASWVRDPAAAELSVLAFLTSLASPAFTTSLVLRSRTPLTPAVVTAVANLGPKLKDFHASVFQADGDQQHHQQQQQTGAEADATESSGGEMLLRVLGPRLERLRLFLDKASPYWPFRSLYGLSHCTALVDLDLHFKVRVAPAVEQQGGAGGGNGDTVGDAVAAEESVLRTLSALSTLRSLQLHGGIYPPPGPARRAAMAPGLQDCLSRLTGLTSLRLGLLRLHHYPSSEHFSVEEQPRLDDTLLELEGEGRLGEAAELRAAVAAEWRAVAAAAACMPLLKELRTPMQVDVADLQALTALTCLRIGAYALPVIHGGGGAGTGAIRRATFALPPRLRRLESHMPLPLAVSAALRPPAPSEPDGKPPCSLLAGGRLFDLPEAAWCIELDVGHMDDDSRLTTKAATDLLAAAEVLRGFGFRWHWEDGGARGVRVCVRCESWKAALPPPGQPPAGDGAAPAAVAAAAGGSTHFGAWLGALAAAVRPEALSLGGLALAPRDVLRLARGLPQLKVLHLSGCAYSVSCLPLLAGLRALHRLQVALYDWQWDSGADFEVWDGSSRRDAVESAFLALTAPVAGGGEEGEAGGQDASVVSGRGVFVPLPALQLIVVELDEWAMQSGELPGEEWLDGALAAAREELGSRVGADGTAPELVTRLT